jgi:hypothetical protein
VTQTVSTAGRGKRGEAVGAGETMAAARRRRLSCVTGAAGRRRALNRES